MLKSVVLGLIAVLLVRMSWQDFKSCGLSIWDLGVLTLVVIISVLLGVFEMTWCWGWGVLSATLLGGLLAWRAQTPWVGEGDIWLCGILALTGSSLQGGLFFYTMSWVAGGVGILLYFTQLYRHLVYIPFAPLIAFSWGISQLWPVFFDT